MPPAVISAAKLPLAPYMRAFRTGGATKTVRGTVFAWGPPQGVPQFRLGGIQFVHIAKHNDFIDRLLYLVIFSAAEN